MCTRQLLTLTLVLMVPALAEGTTYYVDKSGNDGNTCLQAKAQGSAKQSVVAGIRCMVGGDTLIIGDGTYVGSVINIIPSGSAGAPTTIQAAHRNQAVIQGTSEFAVANYTGASYITIDGLVADANHGGGATPYAFYSTPADSTHHIILKNGTAKNGGSGPADTERAAGILWGGHYGQILNMDVFSNTSHGIYLGGHDNIVEGNRSHNNGNGDIKNYYGIHAYNNSGGVNNNIIRNNVLYNNRHWGALLSSGSGNVFYNNIVYGNGSGGITISYSASSTLVYNNTITSNNGYCVLGVAGISNTSARNNICYMNASNSIETSGTTSTISNNLYTNPSFVNVSAGNFHLNPDSVARSAGLALSVVTADCDGVTRPNPPAIGAYEYVGSIQAQAPQAPKAPTNLRIITQ